ncbi:Pre-mRNA-splicing factor cwf25 [Galdieria sulphuraria]|uniref:Pre-mRNA-splicing factor CWC25-like protein n=1 Tax=Galdieria sulphuraria TaxID=130081 RepID=M2VVF6_GALSU|nr:pre-mRNA-splicing factor CWC25-like protein [Galdieria sulphuraria]EME27206.1 pre-mRNA-splicing factor CWC25-like protein [Galdieria sulphuraria]GJD07569.1 Pre-mRNA-splicing factor cwf25 [Galdieria sulphuraria]|eukprot:XP_005703726.1 pre-mRNA-splicing factor CWC25-like protein [Galdieria sulphuraria]
MSALQFLNKKSWHTATLKNNEKVWLAEKKAEEEKKRIEELKKQLEDERHFQELRRLQVESGQLDPSVLKQQERVEWLYEWGKEKDEEEQYLLGKKSADSLLSQKGKVEEESRLQLLTQGNKPQLEATFGLNRLDLEAKLREDPLMEIKRKEVEAIQAIRNNPVKMEKLRRSLSKQQSTKETHTSANVTLTRGDKRDRSSEDRKVDYREHNLKRRHESDHRRQRSSKKGRHSRRKNSTHTHSDISHNCENRYGSIDTRKEDHRRDYSKEGYGLVVPKGARYHGWKPEASSESSHFQENSFLKNGINSRVSAKVADSENRCSSKSNREEILREMQQDAESLENERLLRVEKYRKQENSEEDARKAPANSRSQNFLFQVASEACNRR